MRIEKTEVLVIGAGPAGSVAAAYLNKNGHQVKVIEKAHFPRFVIGESLLPICLNNFEQAGLLEAVRAQQFEVKTGASFYRHEGEFCAFDFSDSFTAGFPHAWQMPRAQLDKALINEAVNQGVSVSFGTRVEAVDFSGEKAIVTLKNKAETDYQIEADFVIDASGYGRVLPRLLDLGKPSSFPARTAFFAHIQTQNSNPSGEVLTEIIDFGDTSWAWVIPFKNGLVSVGFVGDAAFFDQFDYKDTTQKYKAILRAHHRLRALFDENPTLVFEPRLIEGYSVGVKKMFGNKFALAGNATEFLDPIFSSGVAFATSSGLKAAEVLSRQLKGEQVDWKEDYEEHIQSGIDVFRSYVERWYDGTLQTVFFASKKTPLVKKQICSVLAGYVWDQTNPYVRKHSIATNTLAKVIEIQKAAKAAEQKIV